MQKITLTLLLFCTLTTYAQQKAQKASQETTKPAIAATTNSADDTAAKMVAIGADLYSKKKYTEAAAYYTNALAYNKDVKNILLKRAAAYLAATDYKNAEADYTKVLDMDKTNAEAYFQRGICKTNLNDKEGACPDFKSAKALGYKFDNYEKVTVFCNFKK
jgi:tetratricopeptide (TPR) repeat protein